VWGKDDIGRDYRVRQCNGAGLTETDVQEIAEVDRERTTAKQFVDNLQGWGKANAKAREDAYMDDLTEAAGPIVRAGMEREGSTVGYSRRYAMNFDKWIKSL
jgi:hypothetical protein